MKNYVARKHLMVYITILMGMVIPFSLTLNRVNESMIEPPLTNTLSPLGYTYSLLIFAVPLLFFAIWLMRNPQYKIESKAFKYTVLGVFIFGSFLDFVFGYSFFYFPNTASVIGIRLPSFSFETWSWVPNYLPIEEFGFYLLGAMYMISMYLWGVLYWFRRYNHADHGARCLQLGKIFDFNIKALVSCVSIVILGIIYKHYGPVPDGFPGYFTFLTLLAFLPCIIVYNMTQNLINWRAFSFMSFTLILVSIVYEASLGVPYGWWKYHDTQMLGIFITAWSNLPIEAVLLWIAAGFGTVVFYEAIRMFFYMDKPIKEACLGSGPQCSHEIKNDRPIFSSLPDYIDDPIGLPAPRGPYENTEAVMANFFVDVDFAKIQSIIDRYLNHNTPKGMAYIPFVSKVQMTFAKLAGYCNSNDLTKMGQLPEFDLVFWIPLIVVEYKFGIPIPQKIAMFPYRLYVDSAYGLTSGREVFGFRKTFAEFDPPKDYEDPEFTVSTIGFKTFDKDKFGSVLPLFELRKQKPCEFAQEFKDVEDCCTSVLTQLLGENLENMVSGLGESLVKFVVNTSKPEGTSVALKQFRDVHNPMKACYQEVIEAPTIITSLNKGGFCKSIYSLKINDIASNPIAQELGIKLDSQGQQGDLWGFWMDSQFIMGNGKVIS